MWLQQLKCGKSTTPATEEALKIAHDTLERRAVSESALRESAWGSGQQVGWLSSIRLPAGSRRKA